MFHVNRPLVRIKRHTICNHKIYVQFFQDKYGHYYQIWYDDPQSLSYKYQYAVERKMRGVAMWQADTLHYGNSTQDQKMRKEMWGTLPTPKHYILKYH